MEIKAYEWIQNKINNLSQIELFETKNSFYSIDEVNFLCKLQKNTKNLAVIFHGASMPTGKDRIVFRGYEFIMDDSDILAISDNMLNIYKDQQFFWFQNTLKHKFHKKYKKIIEYFVNSSKYTNIVFTGTSAGAYPSVYYASLFHKISLISNPQLYLEKYNGFKKVASFIKNQGDDFEYKDKNIEKTIEKTYPQKIVLYCNKKDDTYEVHVKPFVEFIKKNKLDNTLDLRVFVPEVIPDGKNHHQILFPNGLNHNTILNNFFSSI